MKKLFLAAGLFAVALSTGCSREYATNYAGRSYRDTTANYRNNDYMPGNEHVYGGAPTNNRTSYKKTNKRLGNNISRVGDRVTRRTNRYTTEPWGRHTLNNNATLPKSNIHSNLNNETTVNPSMMTTPTTRTTNMPINNNINRVTNSVNKTKNNENNASTPMNKNTKKKNDTKANKKQNTAKKVANKAQSNQNMNQQFVG